MEPNEIVENEINTNPIEQQNQQVAQQVVEQKDKEETTQQIIPEDEKVEKEPEKDKEEKGKKEIKKHLVQSSNIEWVGYDDKKQNLYVGFLNGSVYCYYNVPKNVFDGLLNAGSHGRYFWVKIRRNNNYEYKRIK